MKLRLRIIGTFFLGVLLIATSPAGTCAQEQAAAPPPAEQAGGQPLSEAEIDTLVAPIALYPDPLISQILPAATYPDDVQAAAALLAQNPSNTSLIDAQAWDLSVKAVAHYPQVLEKMSGDMDWTLALGQAYSQQQDEVFQAVQRLRVLAQSAGTLRDTPQQRVFTELGVIRIVPAQPRMIYVPQYDPEVVYVAGPPHRRGLLSFSSGFMIGSWLNSDLNWRTRRVYYHGWAGPGWISYSRPHIRMSHYYVHDRYHQRRWFNQHPRFHGRPVFRNRIYVNRHVHRYEFNRNRGIRGPGGRFGGGRIGPGGRVVGGRIGPGGRVGGRVDPRRGDGRVVGGRIGPGGRVGGRFDPPRGGGRVGGGGRDGGRVVGGRVGGGGGAARTGGGGGRTGGGGGAARTGGGQGARGGRGENRPRN